MGRRIPNTEPVTLPSEVTSGESSAAAEKRMPLDVTVASVKLKFSYANCPNHTGKCTATPSSWVVKAARRSPFSAFLEVSEFLSVLGAIVFCNSDQSKG